MKRRSFMIEDFQLSERADVGIGCAPTDSSLRTRHRSNHYPLGQNTSAVAQSVVRSSRANHQPLPPNRQMSRRRRIRSCGQYSTSYSDLRSEQRPQDSRMDTALVGRNRDRFPTRMCSYRHRRDHASLRGTAEKTKLGIVFAALNLGAERYTLTLQTAVHIAQIARQATPKFVPGVRLYQHF